MILPYSADIFSWKKYPVTLSLVALNLFLFILVFSGSSSSPRAQAQIMSEEGLILTGRLYGQFLHQFSRQEVVPAWLRSSLTSTEDDSLAVLGTLALRDQRFLASAEQTAYEGDQVRITKWKKDFSSFLDSYQKDPLFQFGLRAGDERVLPWLTYQFSHSNWMHLLSNLMFLIVISMAVESLIGGAPLLFVYLVGGIFGGWGFLLMNDHGTVPMVGASASISALLGFYCVMESRAKTRFFFFISPVKDYFGSIYLPTLLIIPLYLVSDLAHLLSAPAGWGGGVAYAAHLGGAFFGLSAGLLWQMRGKLIHTH